MTKYTSLTDKALSGITIFILLYPFFSSILIEKLHVPLWSSVDEIAVMTMVALVIVRNGGKIHIDLFARKFFGIIFVWLLVGIIPRLYRSIPLRVSFEGTFYQIKNYLLFCLVLNTRWNKKSIDECINILKVLYVIIISFGYLLYFVPSMRIFNVQGMSSIINSPGLFATIVVPVGIYAFIMFLDKGGTKWIVIVGVVMGCLLLAGTIRNIASIMVVYGGYLAYSRRKRKYIFIFLGIASLLIIMPQLYAIFSEEIATNILSDTALNRPRWMLWGTSFKIVRDFFPIGTGFGTFATTASASSRYYSDVYLLYGIHNRYGFAQGNVHYLSDTYWPAVLGETGFIGLLCVLALMIIIGREALFCLRCDPGTTKSYGICAFLIYIALVVESLFTSTMFGLRSYLGICLLGMYCSCVHQQIKEIKK